MFWKLIVALNTEKCIMKIKIVLGISIIVLCAGIVYYNSGRSKVLPVADAKLRSDANPALVSDGTVITNTPEFNRRLNRDIVVVDMTTSSTAPEVLADVRLLPAAIVQGLCLRYDVLDDLQKSGKMNGDLQAWKSSVDGNRKKFSSYPFTNIDFESSNIELYSVDGRVALPYHLTPEILAIPDFDKMISGKDYIVAANMDLYGKAGSARLVKLFLYHDGTFQPLTRVNIVASVPGAARAASYNHISAPPME